MIEKLLKFSVFKMVRNPALDNLLSKLPTRKFKAGQLLMKQGEPGDRGYFLVEGRISVWAESKENIRTTLHYHEAPYLIGIVELWNSRPYLGSVQAMEPCHCIELGASDYKKLLQMDHQLAINVVGMLSQLVYASGRNWRLTMFGKVDHLLANTLCTLAALHGEEHRYGVLIRKDINKSELAEILGVARRSVIRAFEQLENEGFIRMEGKQLIIEDLTGLQRKAQEPLLPNF